MDDTDLLQALGGELPADAAAAPDATEPDGGLSALIADLDPSLADETAPAEDAEGDDGLTAQADESDDADEDDPEALKRELAELRQAKRDAETRAAEAEAATFWASDRQAVDGKLRQAVEHLEERMQHSTNPEEVIREYLPRLINGYTQDLTAHFAKREQAWEQIARKHGAQTYRQEIQRQYRISEAAMDDIAAEFPPEQWHSAAKLHARTQAPLQDQLTTTANYATKAGRAVQATRLSQQIAPGSGRAGPVSMADALDRITEDKADQQLGPILRLMGVA